MSWRDSLGSGVVEITAAVMSGFDVAQPREQRKRFARIHPLFLSASRHILTIVEVPPLIADHLVRCAEAIDEGKRGEAYAELLEVFRFYAGHNAHVPEEAETLYATLILMDALSETEADPAT